METNVKCASGGRINLFWFKNKTGEPVENGNESFKLHDTNISSVLSLLTL